MSNIRLQNILRHKVQEVASEKNFQISKAFIYLMLQEIFELDEFGAEEAITDGGMDKGIDAIFEKEEEGENVLYVIQSKYFDRNPERTIDENSKNLLVEAVSNYVLGEFPLKNLNEKLRKKIEFLRKRFEKGEIFRVEMIFLTNGQFPGENIISELKKFKEDQDGQISYQIITESDLLAFLLPPSAGGVDSIELKIVKDTGSGEKSILNLPDIDIAQGKVFKVDVKVLAQIVKENPSIFSANVRAFQSLKNKVNDQIAATLKDEGLLKEFIYLNNGITIICDDFQVRPGGEIVKLTKPSIINGCQTSNTIFEVDKEIGLPENVGFVLVRVVKTSVNSVKEKIIKASNTQTAIRDRDMISEDSIQKEIESQFLQLGYYYERKRGLHRDKPKEKIIDLEKAAQSYLALYLKKPAEAKNKKSEIYKSYYDQIFNDQLTAGQLLVGYVLFNKICQKIKELRQKATDERKSILGNSVMHLLPLFDEWAIKPSNKTIADFEEDLVALNQLFNSHIEKVIKKLLVVINSIKKSEKNFNPQYFFKSGDSLNKILNTKEGKVDYELELHKGNINRMKDLRYYKPDSYSLDGEKYQKITHWNDLFVKLIEIYGKNQELIEGNLPFINSGSRTLLIKNANAEEKVLRKKINNGLWLLTNFSSKYLNKFCFNLAEVMKLDLRIKLRPTRFRIKKKYKK
jgi:hypothetical protein